MSDINEIERSARALMAADPDDFEAASREYHQAASAANVLVLIAELQRLREDADRYRWAIGSDDNAETLYAAVISCGPSAVKSINIEIDHARAKEKV